MTLLTMYPAVTNSPETELSASITASATTITILNANALPPAPNLATIGTDETAETIRYTAKSGNMLTVERGFQGVAKSWSAGTKIARNFTAYDHDSFRENIGENSDQINILSGNLNEHKADFATFNVKSYGASGSARTVSVSMNSGSNTITLPIPYDFDYKVGQGILITGAGVGGADLITVVTAIDGMKLTLAKSASTTVSDVTVKHDDTLASQAAINAAIAAEGGNVLFPYGFYRISSTLVVDGYVSRVTLVGADVVNTTIQSDYDIVMIRIGHFLWDGSTDNWNWNDVIYYNGVRNLRLLNKIENTNAIGIELRAAMRGWYDTINLDNVYTGIKVRSFCHWNTYRNIFGATNNDVIHITGEGFNAEYNATGCQYSTIRATLFRRAAIYVTGSTFGDMNISDVNGVGWSSGDPLALIALISTGAKHYASRITINGAVCDGKAQHVIYGDGTSHIAIGSYTSGGSVVNGVTFVNSGPNNTYVKSGNITPELAGGTTAGTNTYSAQYGTYRLAGNMCFFELRVALTAKGSMAGDMIINGLPFPAKGNTSRGWGCNVAVISNFNLDATRNVLTAEILGGEQKIRFVNNGNNTGNTFANVSQVTTATEIRVSGFYEVA